MPRLALLLLTVCLAGAAPAAGQDPNARAEVEAVITRLFDGMRESDSAKVRSTFHPEMRLGSAVTTETGPTYRIGQPDGFVRAVGAPKEVIWDERIANLRIDVDGPLATAWMDYAFYAGERFSHCGVNAMQLVRMPAGWQIISLVDTRRQEGCGL